MRIAAHGILGDAQSRTEHARLGEAAFRLRREREDEVTRGAQLRRKRIQPAGVGPQLFQLLGPLHADHEPRASGSDDAQRAAVIKIVGGERQRIENRQALAVVQQASHRRAFLADRDAALIACAADLDFDDAGLGFLAQALRCAAAPRQHIVGGDGGMTDKPGFCAWREKARAQIVIGPVGREYECGIGVIELTRNREHLGVIEAVGIEHHARRIAGEGRARESIDLMNLDTARHRWFCGLTERGAILVPSEAD